ncbi:MAG TPA: class I SAM-dependent methyltransferase [Kofleriaceae bacterium]|jgi:SAM-dependent methyltransferase|nr:class I SAM-dependent methyltransferase [Kofleriaceae bacterium]
MTTAKQHYDQLLGAHYTWSVAGAGDPFERGAAWLTRHGLADLTRYLDLGAGFGAHAVPLARAGKTVTAVDFHPGLLAELRAAAPTVTALEADLVAFLEAAAGHSATDVAAADPTAGPRTSPPGAPWDAIFCLGDTLPHLPDTDAVHRLLSGAARVLVPGGVLALAYRDYSGPPRTGLDRFIPVRHDAQRSLICCIDALDADRISVTDIVTTAGPDGLRTQLSAYPKLRLAPATIATWAATAGLTLAHSATDQGLQVQVFRRAT